MVVDPTGIDSLPNEILISILSAFSTVSLLPLALTSHRFHDLILCILHHRLLTSAQLKEHKLLLECFHPSTKLSTPYLFNEYLDTRPLDSSGTEDVPALSLSKLGGLYSSFRPQKPSERGLRQHPAGGFFTPPVLANGMVDKHERFVCQNVHLESHELFSQLCTNANLVKVGPQKGLFLSCVKIGEGITRVWRHWLAEHAKAKDGDILWADSKKTVGLRLGVVEREDVPPPERVPHGEDPPVYYTLHYEELVIKTTQLLLMVEHSIDQEVKYSGMICGLDGEIFTDGFAAIGPEKANGVFNHGTPMVNYLGGYLGGQPIYSF